MDQSRSSNQRDSSPPSSKRRKLRKGTSSCWECKRRKARCIFTGATDDVCDGCKRRGTRCITQDLPDQPAPVGSNRSLVDRLGQVEALVHQLLEAANNNGPSLAKPPTPLPRSQPVETEPRETSLATAIPAIDSFLPCDDHQDFAQGDIPSDADHLGAPLSILAPGSAENEAQLSGKYAHLRRELLAIWPEQRDLDIILKVPVERSSFIGRVSAAQADSPTDSMLPPHAILKKPPSGSHPVLIAHQLLILSTYLQGIPPPSLPEAGKLTASCQEIMSRIVERVHTLVTCNDELVASTEGIECIMLEALYENYPGKFRRSWLATRRAVAIAQMLGLDRGVTPPSLVGKTVKPDRVWFRLVQLDRYLSMTLGLPQTSPDDSFAGPEILETCIASERMERLNCAAAGNLLKRTPADFYDPAVTKEIDQLLQRASAAVPAQWWVAPGLSFCQGHMEKVRETLRFNDHLMHYHHLLQLHLPYLLHTGTEGEYEYNKVTAITASREILSRILSFHPHQPPGHYCRGVDTLAFIASTALGLAHIQERPQEHGRAGFHFLAHTRLNDRGLMEHAMQKMLKIVDQREDALATTVATLLGYLLAIEEDVASGSGYHVTYCPEYSKEENPGCGVRLGDDGTVLNIYLPHIRLVKIKRISGQTQPLPTILNTTRHQERTVGVAEGRDQTFGSTDQHQPDELSTSSLWQHPAVAQLMPLAPGDSQNEFQGTSVESLTSLTFDQPSNAIDDIFGDVDISFLDNLIQEPSALEV